MVSWSVYPRRTCGISAPIPGCSAASPPSGKSLPWRSSWTTTPSKQAIAKRKKTERRTCCLSFVERGPADAVLALALVHHIAIANNVPLPTIARYFAELSNWLVIELVPKEDEQAQRLLASRRDIFEDYNPASFERAFETVFEIVERIPVDNSSRILYLMRTRGE